MAETLPAGDKIKDYDSRVDPDASPEVAKVIRLGHALLLFLSLLIFLE